MSPIPDSEPPEHHQRLLASRARVARIAHWLDGLVTIPGTKLRFGVDSVVGLIPGVGDVAGMLMGSAILSEGLRAGVPNHLVARMIGNTVIDGLVGAVPFFGDLFDFAFRSNAKNARLLLAHLDERTQGLAPQKPVRRGPLVFLLLLIPLAVFALAVYGLVAVFQRLYS